MKLTNKSGLSIVWEKAVVDDYDHDQAGWRSITGLNKPPQLVELVKRYGKNLTEDVDDRIWSLFGSACHYILAKAAAAIPGAISEQRFITECMGKQVGLKPDLLLPKLDGSFHLVDFKFISVWAIIFEEYEEWFEQTNMYIHALKDRPCFVQAGDKLLPADNFDITSASIEVAMRDWAASDALKDHEYPQKKTKVIPVSIWTPDHAEKFLCDRVQKHITAENSPDTKLEECTAEDRWARPDKFAVKKEGAQKALRVFDTRGEAVQLQKEKGAGYNIEYRPGENIRCERYCPAKTICPQYMRIRPEF